MPVTVQLTDHGVGVALYPGISFDRLSGRHDRLPACWRAAQLEQCYPAGASHKLKMGALGLVALLKFQVAADPGAARTGDCRILRAGVAGNN